MKKLRSDIERYCSLRGHCGTVTPLMLLVTCFNPRMVPVVLLRLAEFFYVHQLGFIAKIFSILNVVFFGIEVSPQVQIGGGLFLPHTVGTVIGAERIGDNCTIMQGVTLGKSDPEIGFALSERPVIGNDVFMGAGAKLIGRITVGDHARIGANAVVLCDVPAYAVAVGVPATIMERQVTDKPET